MPITNLAFVDSTQVTTAATTATAASAATGRAHFQTPAVSADCPLPVILVSTSYRAGGAAITAIKWNSTDDFTLLGQTDTALSFGNTIMWGVVPTSPSTGVVDVYFDTEPQACIVGALVYGNFDANAGLGSININSGVTSPVTVTVPSSQPTGMKVDGVLVNASAGIVTILADQGNERINTFAATGANRIVGGMHDLISTGGSDVLSWAESTAAEWGSVGVELNPFPKTLVDMIQRGRVPSPR